MNLNIKPYRIVLLVLVLNYCSKKCKLQPIENTVFELDKIESKYYLRSDSYQEIDSLILMEIEENYQEESIKTLMNYRECEHYKGYKLKFRNELININLRKTAQSSYKLDAIFFCSNILNEVDIRPVDLVNKKEFVFLKDPDCSFENSQIKKIKLSGFEITSITTTDNKIWIII